MNKGLESGITVNIGIISIYSVQLNITVIIRLIIIRIAYSGFITLVITFTTSIITITIIIIYTIAFNFKNTNINIIIVFINIIVSINVAFIKVIFNTIIDNSFINYAKKLYIDDNYSI